MPLFGRLFSGQTRKRVAEEALRRAGWSPERHCDLSALPETIGDSRWTLHSAARVFLEQYHGLQVDVPIDGCPEISGYVHFSPEAALRFLDPRRDVARLADFIPGRTYPVGTTSGHTVFVLMNEAGRTYLLDMEWMLFGELAATPAEALERLCGGSNGRVDSHVLEDGRLTSQVIRQHNERDFWDLSSFPDLSAVLPPVSLSPLRRPPTWRAMVRAAQQVVASSGTPRSRWPAILITCGGFFAAPSGQFYFVAHCENCLYVRRQAGFQVSAPPLGIPAEHRVGECFPFTPRPGWGNRPVGK
jgi:hypothetical protein